MKLVRSSFLVKLILAIIVVYATVTLVSLRAQINGQNNLASELQAQITALAQENDRLKDRIEGLDTDEGVIEVARDKFGMVGKNEIVFRDVNH